MKLLLVGNHTCGNRGDAAILRGLISELRIQNPHVIIDIYSRFPVSSSYLLGETLQLDPLDNYHDVSDSVLDRLWKRFSRRLLAYSLARKLKKIKAINLPQHIFNHVEHIKQYDAVIQVGGSFFVDLYGPAQFEHALCALLAKKKIFMIGHSVGPFNSKKYAKLANHVFSLVDDLSLRESLSLNFMRKALIEDNNVTAGADTAWLVPNNIVDLPPHILELVTSRPVIAVTLRELAPFDKRLGVTQQEYQENFALLIEQLINDGYKIVLCSTCTGIGSYQRDDRMTALKVQSLVKSKEFCNVIMDELNDVQLGSFLSLCTLTIGTRLHSAIISMNYGTPSIAINYEHKSKGIMSQLDMPELSKDISALFNGELLESVNTVLLDLPEVEKRMNVQVEKERQRARNMVKRAISQVANS